MRVCCVCACVCLFEYMLMYESEGEMGGRSYFLLPTKETMTGLMYVAWMSAKCVHCSLCVYCTV